MRPLKACTSRVLAFLLPLFCSVPALADDSEIFFTNTTGVVQPNILFIIDKSGSMVNQVGATGKTRLQVVQEVTNELIDDMTNVNVGLMKFGGSDGGDFLAPVKDIEGNRANLKTQVNSLSPKGGTPLSETLFEAMRYYQGEDYFIRSSSVAGVMENTTEYKSPIAYECQPNNVILLTDGEPTNDSNHISEIGGVVGECGTGSDSNGNCLDEVSSYMWNNDIFDGKDGVQRVSTYTVGFATDQQLLSDTATKANGKYVLANDAASLKTAFSDVFTDILAKSSTFSAPGIAVNTFDRLNHLDSLYFALFEPKKTPRWSGNLKRYKLAIKNGEAVILDADGIEAVDPNTGFFNDNARSWWSPSTDGKKVEEGGAASQHADLASNRKVYTYPSDSNTSDLTQNANAMEVGNNKLTKAMFGDAAMSDALYQQLINWTRGADVFDADGDGSTADSRKFIADPLHSVPHLIVYGGTESDPDTTVFFGDNQGFIHGINGKDGATHFSFIPEELLSNQNALMENQATTSRIYGMDGTIVSWVKDDDGNGEIGNANGDQAYIYSGMRRGGRNYYALDVTDPSSPSFLWTIKGGVTSGFDELGQTWSKPVKTKVEIGNQIKEVLIFGGGYDDNQDDVSTRTADSVGRAMYIVDAESGARLWWAGPAGSGADLELPDMQYSIPASPKVLDVTGDGLANQIYVGDMGGQIFRFDITNGNNAATLATGASIASLAGSATADNRRFYHSPDLFGIKTGGRRYLGLVIGSGFQAHPLDEDIEDRIYMLRIPDVTAPPIKLDANGDPVLDANNKEIVEYSTLTEVDLYDATENLIQEGTSAEQQAAALALNSAQGYFIKLENSGEKVLSSSQTINNETFITTYEPTPSTNPCVPSAGTSRLYHISAFDGRAIINYDLVDNPDPNELTRGDREVELNTIGIPPDPQRMRVDDTDIVCVGAECKKIDSLTGVVETYWYEE
ncbi:PilC/PilY family type IV pilus protein [Marinobacter sp.]|uniref:PilC/PilY family type IV pilus protein n=1 Tax=Marinobacter sp. TaxID=50741 RepID=UPI00384FCA09